MNIRENSIRHWRIFWDWILKLDGVTLWVHFVWFGCVAIVALILQYLIAIFRYVFGGELYDWVMIKIGFIIDVLSGKPIHW